MPEVTYWLSATALLVVMVGGWSVSLRLRDVSIVDVMWGPAFAVVAWIGLATEGGSRRALLAVLVTVWGLRLGAHLLARKRRERREDPRYGEWRERHGDRFPLVSLVSVFLLQGALVWVVSLPVQAASGSLSALAWAGVAIWAVGVGFEAIGDRQLAAFKAAPEHRGRIMDRGLWRYTRHPNYFGDFLVWWGLYLAAGAWWTVVGPLVMTALLTRVSGKDHLERTMRDRPGYGDYVRRTSGFFPLPPRHQGGHG
jgi:steroid 5-alpha reductase family enzyme